MKYEFRRAACDRACRRLNKAFAVLCVLVAGSFATNSANAKEPVILDTDIGSAIDDVFALGLVLASPEIELRGITTVGERAEDRAWIVSRFLTHLDRRDVPVAFGREPQPKSAIGGQIQYRRHPAVAWNRTVKPVAESAVEFLYRQLKADPGQVTLLAIGPLTNIARLLDEHPDARPWIKRIVLMGGALGVGYNGQPPAEAEWNIRTDIKAAQKIFASGVPLVVVPLDATTSLTLDAARQSKLFGNFTPLSLQIQALYELSDDTAPTLFDPLAIALAIDERFCSMGERRLRIDDRGMTLVADGPPNARVALSAKSDEFLDWYVPRVASFGKTVLPAPPVNPSRVVPRGGLPRRVHVFEDFDSDIEQRWWLAGKLETKDVPPDGRRACRAVLTQDFDDRQGDARASYRAVIFNPVPGPPMGSRTQLAFQYKLHGTDMLRVQLFSLTNNYHRYLSLSGLKQDAWTTAAVDMTQLRRPDGTGGPLAADERIDDIQFYVDPRAQLLIDDIVLYEPADDPADAAQSKPFPRRFLFTGWFDTGKQGGEWPGEFEIFKHTPPRTWKAARAVLNAESNRPTIRLNLRGPRRMSDPTRLRFRYHLSGDPQLQITLVNSRTKLHFAAPTPPLVRDEWSEASLDFTHLPRDRETFVDEILFVAEPGAELLLDDVLLYVP